MVTLYNFDPKLERLPILAFNVEGVDPFDLCSLLATKNIITRAGIITLVMIDGSNRRRGRLPQLPRVNSCNDDLFLQGNTAQIFYIRPITVLTRLGSHLQCIITVGKLTYSWTHSRTQ